MKFGEYLQAQLVQEWKSYYLNYDKLKKMIKQLEEFFLTNAQNTGEKGTSLSIPRPTNAAGMPTQRIDSATITQEHFYQCLEEEIRKIEKFTKDQVEGIRTVLSTVEGTINSYGWSNTADPAQTEKLQEAVEKAGEDFLKLEKYVNLNFTGIHKILKKHDRRLPNPCKAFYTNRLHDQSWVRGDYSDVIVSMSQIYASLRGDEAVEAKEDERQNFVRSTRKYWVHTENISSIKYTVLQHLPVFLQNTMAGESDSQLVNSVYLDNSAMELYHGRLDKTPGAIALRFRWYGTGTPDVVFVERKTHRESWAGEVSVKERFTIKENQVLSLLNGTFDVDAEVQRMQQKGKSEESIREWFELACEVIQAINSKQLVPTMRTQYMRTAFQIPFDATVRVSLDTNLCMISERTRETASGERWFRDPNIAVPLNEITRFPHGVLEVKLQLQDEGSTPAWVTDMLQSGHLLEVHKFSKFIHGGAVLLPEDVCSVPYWIDDVTLAESIKQSGSAQLLQNSVGANQFYQHLLPHDKEGNVKNKHAAAAKATLPRITPTRNEISDSSTMSAAAAIKLQQESYQEQDRLLEGDVEEGSSPNGLAAWITGCTDECFEWTQPMATAHVTGQKVEPKLFFANERTFISWLHMSVILSSMSIGVLAFTGDSSESHFFAVLMMPLSLCFIVYAVRTYLWRSDKINTRDVERWDDPFGPLILTFLLILAMSIQFYYKLVEVLEKTL
eukprot:CAMPEP_0184973280 /NCGR_PEP_ID=MMETSP1098-20130426/5134_1 /TAXON_ID=89044 /ORGANISM="Spumella elongata, Strain CCAP 955/1" /LENGTH=726 /DNA_ID=CAMNT_0027495727 /DNA_START=49 /DNA_END=2229 /DNA_ORIENTATION=+